MTTPPLSTADELYQAGRLDEAVQAAVQEVQKQPGNSEIRHQLCELLCFTGQWERVDQHLTAMGDQPTESQVKVNLFRHLVRAEISRRQFYEEGRLPEFLMNQAPGEVVQLHLQASIHLRENDSAGAMDLLAQADQKRTKVSGKCNGKPFEDLCDTDLLTAHAFEALTANGKYYWIPLEQVATVVSDGEPQDLMDVIWRRVRLTLIGDSTEGVLYLPSLYFGTHTDEDDQYRLGRATRWTGGEGEPVRGVGQRTFASADEDWPLLEIQEIQFDAPPTENA